MQARLSPDSLKNFTLTDCPLAPLTTWKIGGTAKRLIAPRDETELLAALKTLKSEGKCYEVLAGGSNVLINDGVLHAVLLHTVRLGDVAVTESGDRIYVKCGAGVPLKIIFALALREGWSGLETLAGIPGTVGGALLGNAGTSKGEISSAVHKISVIEPDCSTTDLDKTDIEWGYRKTSLSDTAGKVVSSAVFALERSTKNDVLEKAKLAVRDRKTQPIGAKTAGCVFKNPQGHFAGKLLDDAGCKGITAGGARVSKLHANFFENVDNCSANDIIALARKCIDMVKERFGVTLKFEIKTIGFEKEPF